MSPHAWDLSGLDEAGREKRFEVLVDWVGWLTERYGLHRAVPVCWWRHSAMVEELNALELAWSAAYEGEGTDREAPLRWHDELAKSRQRLAEWDRQGCAAGAHREQRVHRRRAEDPDPRTCARCDTEHRPLTRALRPDDRSFADAWSETPAPFAATDPPLGEEEAVVSADDYLTEVILFGGDASSGLASQLDDGEDGDGEDPSC